MTAPAFLVMGAAGKGEQDSGRVHPPGQMPMGRVALECLAKCSPRCPIILTKDAFRGTKCETDCAVATRSGRSPNKSSGLVFGVCVDGSQVSERAFDVAVQFCNSTPGGHEGATDDVFVLHAPMQSSGLTPNRRRYPGSTQSVEKAIRSRYEAECDRLLAEGAAATAAFKIVDRNHCEPIESCLIEACEEDHVDVCFIGSTELARADPNERLFLGSVSAALCRASISHVCVVKSGLV